MEFIISTALILPVVIWLAVSILIAHLASERGRSAIGWFLLSALASPILAAVLLVAAGQAPTLPLCNPDEHVPPIPRRSRGIDDFDSWGPS